ncbi:MAG: response regulator [Planctomycetota bacterium]|jgi:DNA-binding response OmpR family regulator
MTPATILIVDDERHITHVVKYKLEAAGHRVIVASNGREAFEAARQHVPDLVITDYQMPLMSGVELARALRENDSTDRVPVLMVTGRGHRLPASELQETNIRFLMAKPFSPRELLESVDEIIRGKKAGSRGSHAA